MDHRRAKWVVSRPGSPSRVGEVQLELPTVVAVPADMLPDLRYHRSLVRVICRCWSASDGTETEQGTGQLSCRRAPLRLGRRGVLASA
jgi:hypothetical protein